MGLSEATWQQLVTHVGVIYHNAARVNVHLPYSVLRGPNVTGTMEVLRLATTSTNRTYKRVVYVSTLSVFNAADRLAATGAAGIGEGVTLQPTLLSSMSGYGASKRVAELLVWALVEHGLDAMVFRLGMVGPHSSTGASNTADIVNKLWLGMLTMGCAPRLEGTWSLSPVDYVARTVVAIPHAASQRTAIKKRSPSKSVSRGRTPTEFWGRAFHVTNFQRGPSLTRITQFFRSYGFSQLKLMTYSDWMDHVVTTVNTPGDNVIYPLIALLKRGFPVMREDGLFADDQCRQALRLLERSWCPEITENMVHEILKFYVENDLLEPPPFD